MSEGEIGEANMDKSAGRQSSVPPRPNGSDSKKDGNNHTRKRSGKWRDSRPKNDGTAQKRIPAQQPQKFRPSIDKRPRPRGHFNDGAKQEVTEQDEADYGSVFRPGSKKQNYNHLLNFSYGHHRERDGGGGRGYSSDVGMTRRKWGGVRYNKEQFLQANCQFVVAEGEDFNIHSTDPDTLVEWSFIEQVRLSGDGVPSCPICLFPPVAAKMTRCGHIYCWPCILHYLSLSEKSWAKCPICFEAIHEKDLKSVVALATPAVAAKDVLTMTLMRRARGSTYAAPVAQWSSTYMQPYNMQQADTDTCFAKLLTARPDQIQAHILDTEHQQLAYQLQVEEHGSLERTYIEAALEALAKRKKIVAIKRRDRASVSAMVQSMSIDDADEPAVEPEELPLAVRVPPKPVTTYASAFSDDEEEDALPPVLDETFDSVLSGQTELMADSLCSADDPCDTAESQSSVDDALLGEAAANTTLQENRPQPPPRQPNQITNMYYFYQASSGQHIYLHSLNARCLVQEYGCLAYCPPTITAPVQNVDSCTMNEDLRSRMRYINHLPLTCEFQVVELDLKPPMVSHASLEVFKDEIKKHHRDIQKRLQTEKHKLRKMQEDENKRAEQCPQLRASLGGLQSYNPPELRSIIVPSDAPNLRGGGSSSTGTSSPTSITPVGSPPDENGGQTSLSFAQMLRAGKAKAQEPTARTTSAWPATSRKGADSEESDNEDRVPVPDYGASMGDAIAAALRNQANAKPEEASPAENGGGGGKKKKKKVKQLLFSTSMNRPQ